MLLITIFFIIIFSILSTSILAYISMSMMIGPWIHSLIIIITSFIFKIFYKKLDENNKIYNISLITLGSSIGGILATAIGFAFPTLYFLDQHTFNLWLNKPLYFISIIFFTSLSGSLLAYFCVKSFKNELFYIKNLPFAIGTISYDLIKSNKSNYGFRYLLSGIIINTIYNIVIFYKKINSIKLFNKINIYKNISIDTVYLPLIEMPLLISIGFIAGSIITGSLIFGIITNIFLIQPIYNIYFQYLKYNDFIIAFISGIVTYSALLSIINIPKTFKNLISKLKNHQSKKLENIIEINYIKKILLIIFILSFFTYFKFGFLSQIYLISFTIICIYQILLIAGKLSIAPLARFATFVMIPAIIMFNIDYIQITILSSFVEVACGVAVDLMFGRKIASFCNIDENEVDKAQIIGIIASSISISIITYFLISKIGIGANGLIAQRSYTRALTVKFNNFDFYAIIAGSLFGALLNDLNINSIMVLGAFLMPLNWSIFLLIGGLLSYILNNKNKEYYDLFFSGIFSSNSIFITIIKIILN